MVEDLIRKYLGNDIRVYFMKDGLYLMLVVGLLIDPAVRGVWKRATGSAAVWLYAMIAWSVVLSIPMAFVDWRIPLIALKLDWQYVPLVIAGYLLASEHEGVRRLLTGSSSSASQRASLGSSRRSSARISFVPRWSPKPPSS